VYEQENLVLDVIINNLDDGDHPFHLHGHKPFLVGTGAGQYHGQALGGANPMRRDTFLVPAYTWGAFRVVLDHAGYWARACTLRLPERCGAAG
jgi:FtsP/CotA-like multicopper oxidase with cupredoxin domain